MPDLDFSGSAQKLARNPLGIIALFLVLVYGIAGLVFGVAAKNLTETERQPLIWFLVLFPCLVLVTFGWLVAWHHTKLYAPHDYRDPEGFFRALTAHEQKTRLEAEVQELQVAAVEPERASAAAPPPVPVQVPTGTAKEEAEAAAHAFTVSYVSERRARLRANVVLAEDLAFRQLEQEFGHPAIRHVSLTDGVHVDGVFRISPILVVEVKYVRTAMAAAQVAEGAIERAQQLNGVRNKRWRFLLAVVLDEFSSEEKAKFQAAVKERFLASSLNLETRFFEFGELQTKFGVAPA